MTAKTGLDLAFNLGKSKATSIVITPAVYWNLSKPGQINFNKNNAQLAVNVSFIYHFKNGNGTHHFKTYDVGAMINEISYLNGKLAECESRESEVKEVEKIVEKTVTVTQGTTKWIVPFERGKSTLTPAAVFILNQVGENSIVEITATASPDGSKEFNQRLSEMRAARVSDFLTKRGIKVASAEGKGVDPEKGRTAIVVTVQ
jgi:outer membrane protein OmpA-like peptidoglycan-associated protein